MKHPSFLEPKDSIFRASITGIDGSGKDTITKQALEEISTQGLSVVKLGRPSYRIEQGRSQQIFTRTTGILDRMHEAADQWRSLRMITAVNAVNVLAQSRILERTVSGNPDIVVSTRDPRVDPAVYFDYYSQRISKKVSMSDRIDTLRTMTGIERDLIIRLKVDPEAAVERIEDRIAGEQAIRDATQTSAGARDKWRHMHENVDDLTALDAGYVSALNILHDALPATTIVEINTNDIPRNSVVALAQFAILSSRNGSIAAGERINLSGADLTALPPSGL